MAKIDRSKHLKNVDDIHKKFCDSLKIDSKTQEELKIAGRFHDKGRIYTEREHSDESR